MGGEGFGPHDERESLKVLQRAAEKGIVRFDTAGFYAHGRSEELLSRLIRKDRKGFFISTKGGLIWKERRVLHSASPGSLRVQLYESLERLGTDYIDLYQLHWPDPGVSVRESIDALRDFKSEGLIRYWGVGNLSVTEIRENLSGEREIPHQVHFNPLHRSDEILEAGRDLCLNSIISPLEQGLLTDSPSSRGRSGLTKRDHRRRNPCFHNQAVLEWCVRLRDLCQDAKLPTAVVTLLWIASRPHVHVIIPGPRRVSQIEEILRFRDLLERHRHASNGEGIISQETLKEILPLRLIRHLETAPSCDRY